MLGRQALYPLSHLPWFLGVVFLSAQSMHTLWMLTDNRKSVQMLTWSSIPSAQKLRKESCGSSLMGFCPIFISFLLISHLFNRCLIPQSDNNVSPASHLYMSRGSQAFSELPPEMLMPSWLAITPSRGFSNEHSPGLCVRKTTAWALRHVALWILYEQRHILQLWMTSEWETESTGLSAMGQSWGKRPKAHS